MNTPETYEQTYRNPNHFSFGKNWQDFLKTVTNTTLKEARKSLIDFLGGQERIKGKTFIDIGCGSGLFSLAAYTLGAKRVVSVDIDEFSISCATYLKEKNGNPSNWEIKRGSALDEEFMKSLDTFDIVYSWGVLHHTGDMYRALQNSMHAVGDSGLLYLAIYNKHVISWRGGTSQFWHRIKKTYNHSGILIKKIFEFLFMSYGILGMLLRLKNPYAEIAHYTNNRGMTWYNDRLDWLGGYPYEYASLEEVINFYSKYGFSCSRIRAKDGIGCNEYLFIKRYEKE